MRIYILLLLAMVTTSCEYITNLATDGEEVSRELKCGSIKNIIVNSACKIELLPESSDKITIEGYKHLVDGLQLSFGEDSLTINHKNKEYLQKSKLITLRIPANNLHLIRTFAVCELETEDAITPDYLNIVINGVGKFSNANLKIETNSLLLHVYGTGNVGNYYVEGSSKKASFLLEGCVSIDAENFICDNVKINHRSVKDCIVSSTQSLQVSIYSTGNTYYLGSPTLNSQHYYIPYFSSTGEVINIIE